MFLTEARSKLPGLIDRCEAMKWQRVSMHPAARRYFDPYGGLDTLASFMESLAAGKELLFAFGAGMYLLWDRNRRKKQHAHDSEIKEMKERLDILLEKTARIERAQMETTEPIVLKGYLDEITAIKLNALDELTHEDLRGDRQFLIFLIQCGNVINKIQAKILIASTNK